MNAEIANEMTRSRNHADINAVERGAVFGGAVTGGVVWEISGLAAIVLQFYWIGCGQGSWRYEPFSAIWGPLLRTRWPGLRKALSDEIAEPRRE